MVWQLKLRMWLDMLKDNENFIAKLDIRTKISIVAICSVFVVVVNSPITLYLLFCLVLTLHFLAKTTKDRWFILCVLVLLSIWSCIVTQALFYMQEPRTPIFCLINNTFPIIGPLTGGIYIYQEGVEYGSIQSLRSSIMIVLGLLIVWNSEPAKFIKTLVNLNIPYEIAFMLMTALRFFPVVLEETKTVYQAQRLRGYQVKKSLSIKKIRRLFSQTALPVLARSLRRASVLAISVEARGFSSEIRTNEKDFWNTSEKIFSGVIFIAMFCIIVIKIAYFAQNVGFVYYPSLRSFYDFSYLWL